MDESEQPEYYGHWKDPEREKAESETDDDEDWAPTEKERRVYVPLADKIKAVEYWKQPEGTRNELTNRERPKRKFSEVQRKFSFVKHERYLFRWAEQIKDRKNYHENVIQVKYRRFT